MGIERRALLQLATSESFERAVKRTPGGEAVARRAASRYVAGPLLSDGLAIAARLLERGHQVSVDLFGERVGDLRTADRVLEDYVTLAQALARLPDGAWLSVDLSHLALASDPVGTADRLATIAAALPAGRRVQVGAEDASHADAILGCVVEVAARGLADRIGATVQANLRRSPADVDALIAAQVHIRLVKGAYLETAGALAHGEPTDVAFLQLGFRLAAVGARWSMATHDARIREALLLAGAGAEVEQLLGVRPQALTELCDRGVVTRVYVPYGPDWFRYWMRRVAESRGA